MSIEAGGVPTRHDPTTPPAPRWLTIANGLTLARVAALPFRVAAVVGGAPVVACALFWFAVATDLADGRIARRRGEASSLGGLLDHSADALFCSVGLAAFAWQGIVPAPLPFLIAAAFRQSVLDSKSIVGEPLRASVIGRYNGIAYFVLLGTPVVRDALGLGFPGAGLLLLLGWALVASTLLSMADRGWAFARSLTRGPGQAPPQVNP